MLDEKEIDALIRLLDDEDVTIFNQIQGRLISLGKETIPFLEDAWSQSYPGGRHEGNLLLQRRIETIIHKIQFDTLRNDLSLWARNESLIPNALMPHNHVSLLNATIMVARYQYPDIDEKKIRTQIEQIKKDAWLELNDNLTALEKVRVLNHIFYDIHGFSGNTTNFHAPQNSFINNVLESKKGNPLLLSIIYSIVAQLVNMPVFGVNLPEHFVMAYLSENNYEHDLYNILPVFDNTYHPSILFYINAFSKGSVFNKKEVDMFLKQLRIQTHFSYYEPCSNLSIIQRMLRNLINAYEKLGHTEKVQELKRLMEVVEVD